MFEAIVESDKIILENSVNKMRPFHAYLFLCSDETLLNDTSFEFVTRIVSSQFGEELSDIIEKRVAEGLFTDLLVIKKEKLSIGIDAIRPILQFTRMKANENSYRFLIIQNADFLTVDAQNALLKTLEEPNSNIIIILLAQSVDKILSTVISRVQLIHCIEKNEAIKDFDYDYEYTVNMLQEIILFGNICSALQFSQQITKNNKDRIHTILYLEYLYELIQKQIKSAATDPFFNQLTNNILICFLAHITKTLMQVKQNAALQLAVDAMLFKIQEEFHAENSWNKI